MDTTEKICYNMECRYIHDTNDRVRYVNNRQKLFTIYDELYEYFDTDFLE
jgi:hypothetical protein